MKKAVLERGSRSRRVLGLAAMLGAASGVCLPAACLAASTAAVSGIVRDAEGTAQMGAMVQVLSAGSASVATAFTDLYGRYRIANLSPGNYRVRATAVLHVPATRSNLRLAMGARATVNLTLNMLSDPTGWLPVQRRGPDEPGDDWAWTLRSSANKPILRMVDDGTPDAAGRSRSARLAEQPLVAVHASLGGGSGRFGEGGDHAVLALDGLTAGDAAVILRADTAVGVSAQRASTELDAGFGRQGYFGNASRVVAGYASHPEMVGAGNASGMQVARVASAQRMQLGDLASVEAGAAVYAIHMDGNSFLAQPFLRVTVRPGQVWAVEYRLASSRSVQSFDALDSIKTELPVAARSAGRTATENGRHQELGVVRKVGSGRLTAAAYHDGIDHAALAGVGAAIPGIDANGVVLDTSTATFRLLRGGYSSNGVAVTLSQPLNDNLWLALEYASGVALGASSGRDVNLRTTLAAMHDEAGQAAAAALSGRVRRFGTNVRASYRWQPEHMMTAVAPYSALGGEAYFSFYLRQAIRWGDRLPPGLEATVDVTNLLAQGYHPFLSADGQTLYLAEMPRAVQGGLSFTF